MQILHSCASEEGTGCYSSRNHNTEDLSLNIFFVCMIECELSVAPLLSDFMIVL